MYVVMSKARPVGVHETLEDAETHQHWLGHRYGVSHRKYAVLEVDNLEMRKCLGDECGQESPSTGIGNRICPECRPSSRETPFTRDSSPNLSR